MQTAELPPPRAHPDLFFFSDESKSHYTDPAMSNKFSWVLYPYHEYLAFSDEFVVKQLRLRLQGNSLQIEVEQPVNKGVELEARALADRYAKLLRLQLGIPVRVITLEEFGSMPARMITVRSLRQQDRKRVYDAIRKTRNELLASEDVTLRRCYDYIQDAREREEESLFYLYKAAEVIQKHLGGERLAIRALKIRRELKFVKRLASASERGERHAPKPTDVVQRPTQPEKARAMEYAIRIVRKYEVYLKRRGV